MKAFLHLISNSLESPQKKNIEVNSIFCNRIVITLTILFILLFFLSIKTYSQVEVSASVGTTAATYSTVKSAFDKINDGTHQGEITIKITSSTTETASAKLNSSGSGSSNYSSVNIYPTATGLSISGDLSSSIIDLYGADNVTIDGSVNLGGTTASLTITNSNTYKYAYAIRLRQSAENNIIRYAYLKASSFGYGVVRFEGSSSGDGCDNNIIEYCNITNSGNPLVRAIYSTGSDGRENSGNIIRYNNIYDFFSPTKTSYGISLGWKSTNWTIIGNSLYQTNTVVPTGAYRYYALDISNGDDNIISGNYIGGSAPQCEGSTPFSIEAMVPYYFCGIYINGGTAGYLQDNVISNLNFINSEDNPWDGIYINSGNVDVTGNTIGSDIGTGSIIISTPVAVATATVVDGVVTELTLIDGGSGYDDANPPTVRFANATVTATATTTVVGGVITALTLLDGGFGYTSAPKVTFDGQSNYSTSHGIIQNSKGTVNITENAIGSITTVGSDYYTHGFETVYVRSGPSITNLSDNIIGSETTANSIHASSTASFATIKQDLYGLYSSNTGTTTISGNTVANLTNAYLADVSGSYCRGIRTTEGTNTIQNNTVRNLSMSGGLGYSLIGIQQDSDEADQVLSGNEVYNLSNLNSADVEVDVYGIYFKGPSSGTNTINGNFIHDISISSTNIRSSMVGIYLYMGYSTCSNNIINIGESSTLGYYVAGIWDDRGLNNCYFNSIYVGGSVSTGETKSTAALWNQYNFNSSNYRNNIFVNARSGGTSGNHYAIRLAGLTDVTIDYNDYYVSGTSGIIGYSGGDQNTLAQLQTATGQDVNSLNINPGFTTAGGSNADDYVTSASLPGIAISEITTTYHGITRSDPPKMGALEVFPTFIWEGDDSNDFATASNWSGDAVPPDGADIEFATSPTYDCHLDQNRIVNDITNTSAKKLVLNAHELTITGNIVSATANQIDASTASSVVIFAGSETQNIPSGGFVSNEIDALTLNNGYGLTQNGDIIVSTTFILTNGDYSIGANTLTLNGDISTATGTITGGSSTNIIFGGTGANTILPSIELNDLTLNRANGITLGDSVSIAGTLALTAGTLIVGANTLTISGNAPTRVNGNIDASNASATLAFTNLSAITIAESLFAGDINNLTINGEGLTASNDLTVNGILNLQSANPSEIKGSLDMSTFTLNMGSIATTFGVGDVTGIVKRTTIMPNIEYTFGNQFTSATFPNIGTLPTEVSLKISIGTLPSWKSDAVKRFYELIHVGGSDTRAVLKGHYLDSELNGNSEEDLTDLSYIISLDSIVERGRSDINTSDNWVSLSNLDFSILPTSFDEMELSFAFSTTDVITWDGSLSTDWDEASNWTPAYSPDATKIVIIPDASTTPNNPTLSPTSTIESITIQNGAILNSGATSELTIVGDGGAWLNNGTFNSSNGKIIFDHAVVSEIVTIAGTTNFYDIEVSENTTMQTVSGSILRIAGQGIVDVSSIVDFSSINNTVEWNGEDQTIVNPTGIGGNSGYYNLILSGSGTKTMSATAMNIAGDFTLDGTAIATAASALTIERDLIISEGTTLATGIYDHSVGGNFDNYGTFTVSSGTLITLDGSSLQSIFGSSVTSFDKLTINNSEGVNIYNDITVNNTLTLTNGIMDVGTNTLSINGDISKTSGFIKVNQLSSLSFGGTTAISLASNIFYTTPSINNLTINRSEGVVFGSDLTIRGILYLQVANPSSGIIGSLDMGTYTLLMDTTATTIGIGDVTGIVKRTTILPNIEYTFGNQFTSATFPAIGILPTEVALKISIGTLPSWKSDAVKRFYELIHVGGSDTRAVLKGHYLDSELNGNSEQELTDLSYIISLDSIVERGHSETNTTDNWVSLSNLDFSIIPSSFGVMELAFAVSTTDVITWDGSVSTDWAEEGNWTPADSPPVASKIVVIPDASTTPNDPIISETSTIESITIQTGAILNSGSSSELTIVGDGGAWVNNGTFNASTGKVIFKHDDVSEIVTIAGETDFYNIEVGENTTMQPTSGNILRIAGQGITNSSSVVDFSSVNNTVEWNGADQTIVNPTGIGGKSGYYNLILSGSGTKTMPSSVMIVRGDFSTSGTVTAIANNYLLVNGNLTIGLGSAFGTGSNNNLLGGNFENNGTFNASTGGNIVFNDTLIVQTIKGSSNTDFDNLTIDNIRGVSQQSDVNVNNVLRLNEGSLSVGENTLGIKGSIFNPSGYIDLITTSNLSFGGTSAITLNNNLFNGDPTINDLTINRSGGVTLGNENIIVDRTLILTDGTLTIGANSLTLGASASVSGGSATSFVDGPMTKLGTSSFVFPIGNNDKYARIAITNPTSAFTAQYYNVINDNASASIESPITKVSQIEYWDLQPVTSGDVDDVTLYFEDQSGSGITEPSDLRVAHWTGTIWEDLGNATNGSNFVTSSSSPSSFSPFTLATIDKITNPLPVTLISFDAKCDNQKVILEWKTASEYNNDNFFLERSNNREVWSTIATIKGAGNSNTSKSYEFTDFEPNSNANYYRLKQVDFDGTFTYSKVINAECMFTSDISINLFPNPAQDEIMVSGSKEIIGSEYIISNNCGKCILSGNIDNQLSKINIQELTPGVYLLNIKTQFGNVYNKKLVKN